LNIDEQMLHHFSYGYTAGSTDGFSAALNDYLLYDIPQESFTDDGQAIGRVVDPYQYLDNGRFDDMPKLMINSSGDEFFCPDSAQYYFSDLPGTQNYLRYIPNTGHGLNSTDPGNSTLAFFDAVVGGDPLPQFSWTVGQNGDITVTTVTTPTLVRLWQATNTAAKDFRRSLTSGTVNWSPTTLTDQGGGTYVGSVTTPGTGARAYFVELTFDNPAAGMPDFVFTTEVRLKSPIAPVEWPFFMPTNPPPGGGAGAPAGADLDAVAAALAMPSAPEAVAVALAGQAGAAEPAAAQLPSYVLPTAALSAGPVEVDEALSSQWSWADDDGTDDSDDEADELNLVLLGDDWL
jgi:hypothetical protein